MNRDIGTAQSRHHAFIASRHGSPIGKPSNLTAHDSERGPLADDGLRNCAGHRRRR